MMELWKKLMPEDEEIDGALYLAKVSAVRTKLELEELVNELYLKIGISDKIEKEALSEEMLYRKRLPRHGRDLDIRKFWQLTIPD